MSSSTTAPYDNANKPAVALQNPLDLAQKAGTINYLMNQNKLFQARQAAGQAALDATGSDGAFDQTQFMQNLKADPTSALAAQDAMTQGQAQSTAQQGFSLQQQTRIAGTVGSALSLPDEQQNRATYSALLKQELAAGTIDQSHYANATANMPQSDDPSAWRGYGTRMLVGTLGGPQMAQTLLPASETVDDGQNNIPATRNAPISGDAPGARTVQPGAVQKQTSPETNAQMVEHFVADPKNPGTYLKVMVPRSSLPGSSGVAPAQPGRPDYSKYINGPQLPANALGGARPNPGLLMGGLDGQTDPNAPQPAEPAAPAVTLAAPPQGQSEQIAADVGKFKQDQFAIPQGQQNVQSLQKAQIALEASNTGRSSEGVHNMLATMQTLGIPTLGLADSVASYDLAHKYLLDYARKSGAAAHSDLQLQSSEGSNASTGINQQAALDVVHTNIGRERQTIAANMEAAQTGIGYGSHVSKFSNATDPRGFALDAYKPADLNPADPKSMVGKMTSAERAKFYKSAGIAQRLGLLNTGAQ